MKIPFDFLIPEVYLADVDGDMDTENSLRNFASLCADVYLDCIGKRSLEGA